MAGKFPTLMAYLNEPNPPVNSEDSREGCNTKRSKGNSYEDFDDHNGRNSSTRHYRLSSATS